MKSSLLETRVTQALGARLPIIGGPMFLISDPNLVVAISESGGIGGVPSLNWRSTDEFREGIREIKRRTTKPFAVNLIVNAANRRQGADLQVCVEEKVPLVITSLGNPKEAIQRMHEVGGKVFCDVTTLEYAKKVEDQGADGVVAVCAGAGGHAGPISPLVLVPYLKKHLKIPVILAGGVTTGPQLAAALVLGADAVQMGTRFIASTEAKVEDRYKQAILESDPEDIVLTKKVSGTPLSVINTPYVEKSGTEISWIESKLLKNPKAKPYVRMLRHWIGSQAIQKAILGPTYKEVWSAGQGVGLIEKIQPVREIMALLEKECLEALNRA